MNTTIEIDDTLVKAIKSKTGEPSDRQAVEKILRSYLDALEKHKDLLDLAGKVQFYDGYDPKELRKDRDFSR